MQEILQIAMEVLSALDYKEGICFALGVAAGTGTATTIVLKMRPAPLKRNAKGKFQKQGK